MIAVCGEDSAADGTQITGELKMHDLSVGGHTYSLYVDATHVRLDGVAFLQMQNLASYVDSWSLPLLSVDAEGSGSRRVTYL